MRHYETLELVARVLGIDPDADDFDENAMEQALYDKYEISLEHFEKVAELLIPFTVPAMGMLDIMYQGYVYDNAFITKQVSVFEIKEQK